MQTRKRAPACRSRCPLSSAARMSRFVPVLLFRRAFDGASLSKNNPALVLRVLDYVRNRVDWRAYVRGAL